MNFSASDLCKRSASQICYLRKHPNKLVITPEQLSGIKKQANNTKSKYMEMCGAIKINGVDTIYFSWDEVQVKADTGVAKFIEHKQVLGETEDWYLYNSMLQTALYGALSVRTYRYETAKFFQKAGNKKQVLDLMGYSRRFYLQFGNKTYKIKLGHGLNLFNFLVAKAEASKHYDTAKEFDMKYKHREFELLSKYFACNEVQV